MYLCNFKFKILSKCFIKFKNGGAILVSLGNTRIQAESCEFWNITGLGVNVIMNKEGI